MVEQYVLFHKLTSTIRPLRAQTVTQPGRDNLALATHILRLYLITRN
jgi:hypothetical protein